ncbi:hypothetical protein FRB90_008843, partial [Tulasnella sp. 427]
PFVDPGPEVNAPSSPTPPSGGSRGPQIFGGPSKIQDEPPAVFAPPSKSARSFNIFRDPAPTKASSPGQKGPSLSTDNIFTASQDDVFNDSRAHPDTSLSRTGLPDIKFVPSPDVAADHKAAPAPSVPGKESIDFGSLGQPGPGAGYGHEHDDESDWSEDDQAHGHDHGVEAEEHYDDEEQGDEFDENEPPPSFRLKRFEAFDEMTPITERTYEFTRTSSDLTSSARRPSVPAARPRASEVGRPRKSVLPPRASLAPAGEELEPIPNPCNPFEEPVLSELLNVAWVDFADHRDQKCGQLERLQRFGAKKLRTSTDKRRSSGGGETIQLTLGEDTFEIIGKLGEGGFGAVFLARLLGPDDYDDEDELLFAMKAYIDTTTVDGPDGVRRYKIATPLKRYWNTDLWSRLFDVLLNPRLVRPDQKLPVSNELAVLKEEMEQWLVVNSVKGKGGVTLKAMLKKILRWSM